MIELKKLLDKILTKLRHDKKSMTVWKVLGGNSLKSTLIKHIPHTQSFYFLKSEQKKFE